MICFQNLMIFFLLELKRMTCFQHQGDVLYNFYEIEIDWSMVKSIKTHINFHDFSTFTLLCRISKLGFMSELSLNGSISFLTRNSFN